MLVLGVDTSLPLLSVALVRDDKLIGSVVLEGKDSRNEKILPAIDWLLTESGISRSDIELFAVTRGPGSFTGVRIGLATVQGLALALGRPVCAMSTHEAIARADEGPVMIVDDAGRGEFYLSRFEAGLEVIAPRLATARECDHLGIGAETLTVSEFLQIENVAAACARSAATIAQEGRLDAYADATPIYVRLAEAEAKLQRSHG